VQPTFNNTGSVLANAATLNFSSSFTQTSGSVVLNGGSVSTSSNLAIQGGTVAGSGTIVGNISNTGGTLSPGASTGPAPTAGAITINGSGAGKYLQSAAGVYSVKIGGTSAGQFDTLTTTGAVTLGASLNVSLINGFTPSAGQSFVILQAGSISGQFATTNLASLGMMVNYSSTAVTLTVGTAPAVTFTPNTLAAFANTIVGNTSATQSVSLSNTGSQALSITSIGAAGTNPSDFVVTNVNCPISPATLAPSAACTITISFRPTATGTRAAAISVADNASGSPQQITLSGVGIQLQSIAVTPASPTITLGNNQAFTATGTFSDNSTANVAVTWTLTQNSAACSPACGTLSSTSTNPTTYTSPATLPTNATVTITATSASSVVGSTNLVLAMNLVPIQVSFSSAPPASIVASGAVNLSANVANDGTNAGVDWTVTCGSANCGSFSPVHTASGTTTVYTAPSSVPTGNTVTIKAASTANPGQSAQATITIAASSAPIYVLPFEIFYDGQTPGTTSPAQTATLFNTTGTAVPISGVTLAGHAASDFSVINNLCQPSVNASSSCTIGVTFTPSTTVPGPRTADLTIASSGTGAPYVSHLTGNGALRHLAGFTANTLAANDDDSTAAISLGFTNPINFFGTTYSQTYVNNNGNITFGGPCRTYTPSGLTSNLGSLCGGPVAIVAPFFADVDTVGVGSGVVTYGNDTVNGRPAFGADYENVGYFSNKTDKLNSFQVILIDRSDVAAGDFDIEFNYDKIQWETGDDSGGVDGLGGTSAAVGYSNGTGTPGTNFQLPGSLINGALLDVPTAPGYPGLINAALNSTMPGRYDFQVRSGAVQSADLSLAMAQSANPVAPGSNELYTLTVANAGPNTATNVTVTDTLPANATLVSATPSQGAACSGTATVTCNLGTLVNAGSATVTVIVRVSAAASGTVVNGASVTSDLPDPNTANNSASATATVSNPHVAASIVVTSGSSQNAVVSTAFAAPLVATVTDAGGNPVSGVTVTFAAPGTGASGTFAGGANTAVTNTQGVATSAVFTANGTTGSYTVTASVAGVTATASFSLMNKPGAPASIAVTSGSSQSAAVSTAFAVPLVVTVSDAGGNAVSGVTVTFAAPGTGASGTFAGGVNTALTNAQGVATSPTFTANATTGSYTVVASVAGVTATASFSLTNTPVTTTPQPVVVTISPQPTTVVVGSTVQFGALVQNAGTSAVTWQLLSGPGTGSIDPTSGLYTPPQNPPPGPVVIQATSVADPTKTQQISFTIQPIALNFAPGQPTTVSPISSQGGGSSSTELILNAAPTAGSGTFALTCDQMPPGAACTINPTTVSVLPGQPSQPFRLTVFAAVSSSVVLKPAVNNPGGRWLTLAISVLGSMFLLGWSRNPRFTRALRICSMVFLICFSLAFLAACSGISPTAVTSPSASGVRSGSIINARVTATPTSSTGGFTATQMIVPFPVQ
jgi:uncharacterized repeat protein (TIGR01451 family)